VVPASFEDFLKAASKKLEIQGKYAYSSSGGLIDDVDLLREDDDVYISERSGFYRNEGSARRYKIAILGPGGVGKSCVTIRYTKSTFVESYDPTIEDAFRHQTVVDDRVVQLEILDTAGQEEFKCLSQSWVEGKDGFLLIFSLTDASSLQGVAMYYSMIEKEAEHRNTATPPIVLCGNKADTPDKRKITAAQAQEKAQQWNAILIETSARTGANVDKAFEELIRAIRKARNEDVVTASSSPAKKRSLCILL
jgi:small GTP-binding protein